MVRVPSDERVQYIAKESHLPSGKVKMVLTLNKEYSENHKRQPRPPAPEGGISLSEAERKYSIPNETIGRWVKRGYLTIILRTNREVYISEYELAKLASIYRENPGRGSWAIKKACGASTVT